MLIFDGLMDGGYLFEIKLTCKHHDIGKLCIELQCFDIGDVQLGTEVHLLSLLVAISHHSNITGYHRTYPGLFSSIDDGVHGFDILTIYNGVDGEITLHTMRLTLLGYLPQIIDGEGIG